MKNIFYFVSISILLFSCAKENETPINQQVLIQTIQAPNTGYSVQLWADKATFEVGYEKVYFHILQNNEKVQAQKVHFYPWMDMGMHQHGAPSEELVWNNGTYEGAAIFSMASTNGSWELILLIENQQSADTVSFAVNVNESAQGVKKVTSVTGSDTKKYIIALKEPKNPKIGVNDLALLVYENQAGNFVALENLTISIDPQMTSMGHGSPNNVHPVWNNIAKHYEGKVNFTMSGDWRLFMDIENNGNVVVHQAFLDFNF